MMLILVVIGVLQITQAEGQICGMTPYDPSIQKCCKGELNPLPYGTPACCRTKAFNRDNYMCCKGNVTPRPNSTNVECCGKTSYNKDTEMCCGGKVFFMYVMADELNNILRFQDPGCCGDQMYDKMFALCCNNVIRSIFTFEDLQWYKEAEIVMQPKINNIECCGTKLFDKSTQDCCRNHIISKDPECEDLTWDFGTELCCKGVIHTKKTDYTKCCGKDVYTPGYSHNVRCCGGVFYDLTKEYGESYNYYCCHDKVYNEKDQVCCDGYNIITIDTTTRACCGGIVVRFATTPMTRALSKCCQTKRQLEGIHTEHYAKCCNGVVKYRKHQIGGWKTHYTEGCCGDDIYDLSTSLCCGGHIVPLGYGAEHCCGNTTYDFIHQICCEGHVYDLFPPYYDISLQCCGHFPYLSGTSVCCDGVLYPVPKYCSYKCCGKHLVTFSGNDLLGHECCDGRVYPVSTYHECCGRDYYNASKETLQCCNDIVIDVTEHICCGGNDSKQVVSPRHGENTSCCASKSFDMKSEICCVDVIHKNPPPFPACCGRKVYNTRVEMCCGDVVNPLLGPSTICCHYRSYDSSVSTCCGQNVFHGRLSCCGVTVYNQSIESCCGETFPYDPNTEDCIGGLLYQARKIKLCQNAELQCCTEGDNSTYDVDKELCCNGIIHSEEGVQCCGVTAVDPMLYKCCSGNPIKATADVECCGNKLTYNTDTHICCDNKIVLTKLNSTEKLCGCTKYEENAHICCEHKSQFKLFPITDGDTCCLGLPYFNSTTKCYFGGLKRDPYPLIVGEDMEYCSPDEGYKEIGLLSNFLTWHYVWEYFPSLYNSKHQLCCLGMVVDNPTGELGCCGGESVFYKMSGNPPPIYNKTSQKCCDDVAVNKDDLCCWTVEGILKIYQNPYQRNLTCCQGGDYTVLTYDQDTEKCEQTYVKVLKYNGLIEWQAMNLRIQKMPEYIEDYNCNIKGHLLI